MAATLTQQASNRFIARQSFQLNESNLLSRIDDLTSEMEARQEALSNLRDRLSEALSEVKAHNCAAESALVTLSEIRRLLKARDTLTNGGNP